MTLTELQSQIALGNDSRRQFKRALDNWRGIDFADDLDDCLFTARVHRKEIESSVKPVASPKERPAQAESSLKSSLKTENRIIELIKQDASVSTEHLGVILDISKRAVLKQIRKLKEQGRLKRVGPAKGGHWEVIE